MLLAAIALWVATGARFGWTQTSTVQLRTDEITGIEYPVRQANFVAGVEIPLAAVGIAAVLAGLSFVAVRRTQAQSGPTPLAETR